MGEEIVVVADSMKPATRRLLGLAGVVVAVRGVVSVDDFALRLRAIPSIEVWPQETRTGLPLGPVRKGRGGKVRRW